MHCSPDGSHVKICDGYQWHAHEVHEPTGAAVGSAVVGAAVGATVVGVAVGVAVGAAVGVAVGASQLVSLHTNRASMPQPLAQHVRPISSSAVHSRSPRDAHSRFSLGYGTRR